VRKSALGRSGRKDRKDVCRRASGRGAEEREGNELVGREGKDSPVSTRDVWVRRGKGRVSNSFRKEVS